MTGRPRVLTPVRPNAGLEALYRRKLLALIEKMHASVVYWVTARYKANEPRITLAADELPARALERELKRLIKRWRVRIDETAPALAAYFAKAIHERSDAQLKAILERGGIKVKFKLTPASRDILQASIAENVALIRSIPERYFTEIEGHVMRAVKAGRKLDELTETLRDTYGVTKRRAAFISRDQNNKATAAIIRARQVEVGIQEAIWMHSGGGKQPRPAHLKAGRDRVRYDVRKGWYDPHEKKFIWPGELPNCRCVSRSVVPGFS